MKTGDEFYLMDDRKLVCKADYETAKLRGGRLYKLLLGSALLQFFVDFSEAYDKLKVNCKNAHTNFIIW